MARSNAECKLFGGKHCLLNYEEKTSYDVVVKAWDTGYPSLSVMSTLTVELKDLNDPPRNLKGNGRQT